jgi:hypothetical protein
MRKRDLRIGLHVTVNGEHGVTDWLDGNMVIHFYSVYGGEGYQKVQDYIDWGWLGKIKLVDRCYDPHEK